MPQMTQIKASAGSGKTYTLTRSFLETLASCSKSGNAPSAASSANASFAASQGGEDLGNADDWRSIMAITFTNAAAQEMQDRVLLMLKQAALGLEKDALMTQQEAGRWIERILRDRASLNISTIDSLLNLLVRMSALSLGIPPDFTPAFATEDILKTYWEQFSNEAWLGSRDARELISAVCHDIVVHGEQSKFSSHDTILNKLNDLMPLLISGALSSLTPSGYFLTKEGKGILPAMRRKIFSNLSVLLHASGRKPAGENDPLVYHKSFLNALQYAHGFFTEKLGMPADEASTKVPLSAYAKMRIKSDLFKSAYWYKDTVPVTKKSAFSQEAEDAYLELKDSIQDFMCLEAMYQQTMYHAAIFSLAVEIFRRYEDNVQEQGQIFNDRIPFLVQKILSGDYGVSDALCRLGTSISHFLIDEFQDTSREHWEALRPLVVEALSTGGTFTWVGDVKQAIYGFRGGDSQLFDDIAEEQELTCLLDNGQAEKRTLDCNWRSRKEIIRFNNALFSPLEDKDFCAEVLRRAFSDKNQKCASVLCREIPGLAPDTPDQTVLDYMAGKVARAYAGAAQQEAPKTKDGGRVVIVSFTEQEGSDDAGGDTGSETPDSQTEATGLLVEKGHTEGRPWSDFLVLVRKNKDAMEIARHLSSKGIPVITENSLLLADHPLIVQTVAMLTFLRTPENNIAFWTMMTGSLFRLPEPDSGIVCGISDTELLQLARQNARKDSIPLYLAWKNTHPAEWKMVLEPLMQAGKTLPPYDLVSDWYRHMDVYRHEPDAAPFLRRFLEVLSSCRRKGLQSASAFLEYWAEHGAEEKLPMPRELDAVSIMTVHKAKGLQAKVVIVPKTSSRTNNRAPLSVVEYLPQGASEPVRSLCRLTTQFPAYGSKKLAEAFESINNFYVACTRAEEELWLFVSSKAEGDGRLLEALLEKAADETKDIAATIDFADAREGLLGEIQAAAGTGQEAGEPEQDAGTVQPKEADGAAGHEDGYGAGHKAGHEAGHDQASPCQAAAAGPEENLEEHIWHPLSWMPELKLSYAYMEESHPRDMAREEGIFIHACLEDLARLPRQSCQSHAGSVPSAEQAEHVLLQRARKNPFLSGQEGFLERIRKEIGWFMQQAQRFGWLAGCLPEQGLTRKGRTMRMDLYIPDKKHPVVLEYKTGITDDEYMEQHHSQVRNYLAALAEAGGSSMAGALGVVVYLKRKSMHIVLPDGASFADTKISGPKAHSVLLDEEGFALAMQKLCQQD